MVEKMISLLLTYLLLNLILLPLAGPPLAGMTYVVRNYARDEHAWLWSDFKEQMKKNWKQSAAMMLILDIVLIISVWTLWMYGQAMGDQPWMWVMQMLFIVFVCLFILSYMYAFPMLVTYKLKLSQIIQLRSPNTLARKVPPNSTGPMLTSGMWSSQPRSGLVTTGTSVGEPWAP
jgi:uncharacterized membrane protein YesL